MKKTNSRVSSFLPKQLSRLQVVELESRDVPASFWVDPTLGVSGPTSVNTSGGQFTGVAVQGTQANGYNNLAAAIAAANANVSDAISSATRTLTTATITTTAPHGFTVGSSVTIAGVTATGTSYNGTFTITAVPTTTSFQYALTSTSTSSGTGGTAAGVDAIYLANSTPIGINNPITITGNTAIIGSTGSIVNPSNIIAPANLNPSNPAALANYSLIASGVVLNLSNFTYNGTGIADSGILYNNNGTKLASGSISNINFTGFGGLDNTGTPNSYAVQIRSGSNVSITDSTFNNTEGRGGVYVYSNVDAVSYAKISNSIFLGAAGDPTDRANYGVEIAGHSSVTVTGSTFANNTAFNGSDSAGIVMYNLIGSTPTVAPVAFINHNDFVNNSVAVMVGDLDQLTTNKPDGSSALIAYNNFLGQLYPAVRGNSGDSALANGLINANNNYWNVPQGPWNFTGGVNSTDPLQDGYDGTNIIATTWLTSAVGSGTPDPDKTQFLTSGQVNNTGALSTVDRFTTNAPTYTTTNPTSIPASTVPPVSPGFPQTANPTVPPGIDPSQTKVAYADVNGDGFLDIIVGYGGGSTPVTNPLVNIYSGFDGSLLGSIAPNFGANKTAGVYVAAGYYNGDNKADVVVSYAGAGSLVQIYDGAAITGGASITSTTEGVGGLLRKFAAFSNSTVTSQLAGTTPVFQTNYNGGATVAAGDVNGDGVADIVVGMTDAVGVASFVRVYDGKQLQATAGNTTANPSPTKILVPFENGQGNPSTPVSSLGVVGVNVAVGDVDGDGLGDIVVGNERAGTTTTPANYSVIRVYSYSAPFSLGTMSAPTAVTGIAATSATVSGSTVATFTKAGHGFLAGQQVKLTGFSVAGYNGGFTITSATANTFTVRLTGGLLGAASGGTAILDYAGISQAQIVNFTAGGVATYVGTAGNIFNANTPVIGLTPKLLSSSNTASGVGSGQKGVRVAARDLDGDGYSDILFTFASSGGSVAPTAYSTAVYAIDGKSLATLASTAINTVTTATTISVLAQAYVQRTLVGGVWVNDPSNTSITGGAFIA